MTYYNKLGSIPTQQIDDSEGWVPAPAPPECPEGKEVVWWGNEWVIRDPKPVDRPGWQWNWKADTKEWIEGQWPNAVEIPTIEVTFADSIAADSIGADSV